MTEWPLCARHNELLIKIVAGGPGDSFMAQGSRSATQLHGTATFCKLVRTFLKDGCRQMIADYALLSSRWHSYKRMQVIEQ